MQLMPSSAPHKRIVRLGPDSSRDRRSQILELYMDDIRN